MLKMGSLLLSSILCVILCLINSGFADLLFDCTFEDDNCGFIDDYSVEVRWKRNQGKTPSRETGPETDYTNGTEFGYYSYAEATGATSGEKARMYTPTFKRSGGTCTRIQFHYYIFGEDNGYLHLYILGEPPYYFINPVWEDDRSQQKYWKVAQLDISISANYSIAFETIFERGGLTDNRGDIAIDGISVDTVVCDYDSCENHVTCLNGGTCVEVNSGSGFEYRCECAEGWSGDHCENDFDECSNSPCQNGANCVHGLNEFHCQCDLGFYGELCQYVDMCVANQVSRCYNGGTCNNVGNDFNCTCGPGYTGDICDINIDDCVTSPCKNGGKCVDGVDSYTCQCAAEYRGFHCQSLTGGCDFDDNSFSMCGYRVDWTYELDWELQQGRTPIGTNGPSGDHTTGLGYYAYADANVAARETARLITAVLPQASAGACTNITFWYYMDGDSIGTLNVYVSTGSQTIQSEPSWTLSGGQGNIWHEASFEVSSPVPYMLIFDGISTFSTLSDYIAIDDIAVYPGTCPYQRCSSQPCQNGGTCIEDSGSYKCECPRPWAGVNCEEDLDECTVSPSPCINSVSCTDRNPGYECNCLPEFVGYSCEYIRGSCDFEDPYSRLCQYTNDLTGDFYWTPWQGSTPTDLTGPSSDHTLRTDDGYYIYTETTPRKGGDKARIMSPVVPNSGSRCTGVDFWYHMRGADVGELALYVEFGNEPLTIPIWNIIGDRETTERKWIPLELNISAPSDFRLVFEVTVLPQGALQPENRGDIAIDDIKVHFDRNCNYDKCFEKPCQNDAVCTAIGEDDYFCECKVGYDGKNCDNSPACVPNPCQNEGTCILGSGGEQECLCKHGWKGPFCDEKDYCYPNPCENGGTCNTFTTTYDCQCQPGFLGDTCEIDINECESSPCRNGAQCLDLPNAWQCNCVGQYFGDQCNKIEGGCDFQGDYCGWASESLTYTWNRESGTGPNWPLSGPRNDHTFSNSSGFYILTEVYSDQPVEGTRYRLQSPTFSRSVVETGKILTFQFYYHMFGTGMGNLNVYFQDGTATTMVDQIIQQDDEVTDWQFYSRKFEPVGDFGFIIEHETIQSVLYMADMAVDDIDILIEDAGTIPDDSTTLATTTSSTTTTPTTTTKKATVSAKTTTDITTTPGVLMTTTTKQTGNTDAPTPKLTTSCDDDDECDVDDDDDDDTDGLEGGAIAGIVIAVLVVVAGLSFVGLMLYRGTISTSTNWTSGNTNVENPLSQGVLNASYSGDSEL